jgi:hypothetical protein
VSLEEELLNGRSEVRGDNTLPFQPLLTLFQLTGLHQRETDVLEECESLCLNAIGLPREIRDTPIKH